MPVQTITGPDNQQLTQGQVQTLQKNQVVLDAYTKAKQTITGALVPGWVILALGASGYLLSETHIFGPVLAILLAIATIFQLNQWTQQRGGKLL